MQAALPPGPALDRPRAARWRPISWGVCEVPGWGRAAAAPSGFSPRCGRSASRATEAGRSATSATTPRLVRAVARAAGLGLVGGFLPVVLHDPAALEADARAAHRRRPALLARAGGSMLVSAVVVDVGVVTSRAALGTTTGGTSSTASGGSTRSRRRRAGACRSIRTSGRSSRREDDVGAVARGMRRPPLPRHRATSRSADADIVALACEAPDRVGHVHLKDVREDVAEELRTGRLEPRRATQTRALRAARRRRRAGRRRVGPQRTPATTAGTCSSRTPSRPRSGRRRRRADARCAARASSSCAVRSGPRAWPRSGQGGGDAELTRAPGTTGSRSSKSRRKEHTR